MLNKFYPFQDIKGIYHNFNTELALFHVGTLTTLLMSTCVYLWKQNKVID